MVVAAVTSGQLWVVLPALETQRQLIRAMSPEDKIRASEALREAAWELKAAWIRQQHPGLAESAVQDAVRRWFSAGTA
ncbi:MAG: hypothetical protein ACREOG_20840 [Gemmatimonadaceae bacterium]